MSAEWRRCRWGDLATLEYGKGIRTYHEESGPYPVYGTNGSVGWYDEALCQHPGVIVGRKGAYRGIHYSSTPFYVIDTAFYLEPRVELDLRWAYYQLLTFDINNMDSGSAIPSTSRDSFYQLPVLLPPLSEQRAIAAILGALDDKIERNRRMNQTLEALAQALFQSWFVDFDPVRAKIEGRQPAGMDADTATLFSTQLTDSPFGRIPETWAVNTLGTLADLVRQTLEPSAYPTETFDHYSIPAFDEGQMPYVEAGERIKSGKFLLPDRAVLLSKLNPRIPRVWIPNPRRGYRAICSTEFLVIIARPPATLEYLHCLFRSPSFADTFATLVTGTSGSHQRVQPNSVLGMSVVIPSSSLLVSFSNATAPMLRQLGMNRQESQTIAALRDTLLAKLLSGELLVPEAEKLVGSAV